MKNVNLPVELVKEIRVVLEQRGIEAVKDWSS